MERPIITLLTDFGEADGYVGIMKGVILGINPEAQIVDLSHQVPPHDIEAGAFLLKQAYRYFPKGTIHVVVIDPGVGSDRKALAVATPDYTFLAPDNGVLKYVFQAEKTLVVVALSNRKYFLPAISRTFHGRDVFAPVAAHLSLGLPLESLGEAVDNYIAGQLREPSVNQEGIEGQILYVDRFGNLITNISEALVKQYLEGRAFEICLGNRTITRISRCYSEGSSEEPVAVLGSSGYLEISVNQARADRLLGVKEGDTIRISFIR